MDEKKKSLNNMNKILMMNTNKSSPLNSQSNIFCFSHTHTKKPVSLVGVGSGDSSSTRELISVPRVFTFPFQEGRAGSPEGHG